MLRRFPALYLLLFVVGGIVLGELIRLPLWLFFALLFLATVVVLVHPLNKIKLIRPAAIGLAVLFFSAFNFARLVYHHSPTDITHYTNSTTRYHIFGTVSDWPLLKKDRTEIKVELDSLSSETTIPVSGTLLLRVSDSTTILQRGDRVEFFGRIYPVRVKVGGNEFDYGRYLRLQGIGGIVYLPTLLDLRLDRANRYGIYRLVSSLRQTITGSFYRNLSPTSAALSAGFLIGETHDIPPDVYAWFRDSGTLHLLAVSGSNVGLIILFITAIMAPLSISRNRRFLFLLITVFIFALLSYGEPSVVRASVMAALVIGGKLINRRVDLNQIIAATAVIILLYDPRQFFGVGFQLSFVVAWGLILYTKKFHQLMLPYHARRWYRFVVLPVFIALTAQLCSMPLIAFYFERIPLFSVLANIVIVPLVSVATVGIMILLLLDLIWPLLGYFFGSLLNYFLELLLRLLQFFGADHVPLMRIPDLPLYVLLGLYMLIILGAHSLLSKRARRWLIFATPVVLLVTIMPNFISAFADSSDQRMIRFTSVPGGIIALVKSPDSNSADLIIAHVNQRPYPIDEIILTPLLQRNKINKLNSLVIASADYGAIDDLVRLAADFHAEHIAVMPSLKSSVTDLLNRDSSGSGLSLKVLYPTEPTESQGGYYNQAGNLSLVSAGSDCLFVSGVDHLDQLYPDGNDQLIAVWTGERAEWSVFKSLLGSLQPDYLIGRGIIPANSDETDPIFYFPTDSGRIQVYDLNLIAQIDLAFSGSDPAKTTAAP